MGRLPSAIRAIDSKVYKCDVGNIDVCAMIIAAIRNLEDLTMRRVLKIPSTNWKGPWQHLRDNDRVTKELTQTVETFTRLKTIASALCDQLQFPIELMQTFLRVWNAYSLIPTFVPELELSDTATLYSTVRIFVVLHTEREDLSGTILIGELRKSLSGYV